MLDMLHSWISNQTGLTGLFGSLYKIIDILQSTPYNEMGSVSSTYFNIFSIKNNYCINKIRYEHSKIDGKDD